MLYDPWARHFSMWAGGRLLLLTYQSYRELGGADPTHHSAPIQNSCSGRRQRSRVAGRPAIVNPCRAAWTFAGNIATSSAINPYAAAGIPPGTIRPIAPSSSSTPVADTISAGAGTLAGTIRIMSD